MLAVTVGVLLGTLLLWSWLAWHLFSQALAMSVETQARMEAAGIAADLKGTAPELVVRTDGRGSDPDTVIQVVRGDEVMAFMGPAGATPLSRARPATGEFVTTTSDDLPGIESERFALAVLGAVDNTGSQVTVMVAQPVHPEGAAILRIVGIAMVALLGVLAVGLGLVRWAISSALDPVERLRAELQEIGARLSGERVAVPPTGDELQRLGDTMNELLGRLESADLAQRRFVSDASHELRSPLASMRTLVEVAQLEPNGARWSQTGDLVAGEIARLQRIVDDLLTLSRADAGALRVERRPCDADDEVVRVVQSHASAHSVAVEAEPVQVLADPDRLAQILHNLLANAAAHAASTTRVEVGVVDDQTAFIRVDNDGPEVPEGDRERVFQRFVRLDNDRSRRAGGSGLGLAISAELARAMGGIVTTGVAPDGWCRFEVRLPRVPD